MNRRFLHVLISGTLALSIAFSGGVLLLSGKPNGSFTVCADPVDGYEEDEGPIETFVEDETEPFETYGEEETEPGETGDIYETDPSDPITDYESNLPVIYINTENGQGITNKTTYIPATMEIRNSEDPTKDYSGTIQIKGRGNSSWIWPKKPYKIKLDSKADLLGMGSNKHWVLLANYLDESLLRNTMAFRLAEQMGVPAMQTVWTDVVLNGEYIGNYQLCEQIRVGKERVDIFDWEDEAKEVASTVSKKEKKTGNEIDKDALEDYLKENLSWITEGEFSFGGKTYTLSNYGIGEYDYSGGYLFELSDEYDAVSQFKTDHGLTVMLNSPEYLNTNSQMMAYVQEYWQDFENAYRSEDGYTDTANGRKHYTEFADIDSMVSYWLVMEIVGNDDAGRKSRYAYMDTDGIIRFGPVWDFDWGCGTSTIGTVAKWWKCSKYSKPECFFYDLTDDPLFIAKATEKYWQIRPYLQTIIEYGGQIDQAFAYLKESGEADQARWDRSKTWYGQARGFEKDVKTYKIYLKERFAWLDAQFSSDSTLIKSLNTDLSAYPYTKSTAVAFTSSNGSPDTLSTHAPADYLIEEGNDLQLTVKVTDTDSVSINVYVNGLEYTTADLTNGSATISISADRLDALLGSKNVISIIAKNASGATTQRSFATVIQTEAPAPEEPEFAGNTLILDGKIGVNFFMNLSGLTDEEKEACYVEFTVNGETTTDTFDATHKDASERYFGFTCYVSSVQMAETITAEFHYGDDKVISTTYSVLEYTDLVDAHAEDYDAKTLALVQALADYGHYIQPFCAYNNEWTVGDRYAEMSKHYTESYDYDAIKELIEKEAPKITVDGTDNLQLYIALVADTDTSIQILIDPGKKYTGTLAVDGEVQESHLNGRYLIEIPGIAAHKLAKSSTKTITTDGGTTTIKVSAMSYVYSILNSSAYANKSFAKDAVCAMYKYYEAANAYKKANG
ncbi:MAG: CotH kinase family protein [Clostridiales bacterium]|nr:CotH kinase family protein [Clostridiales bacterium]